MNIVASDTGLTLADILGIVMTFMSIMIAIIAVYIAFGFGRKYNEHINDIKLLQQESAFYRDRIESNVLLNKESIMLMKITMYHLYKLHDASNRVEFAKSQFEGIKISGSWAGRVLAEVERDKYLERAEKEIDRLIEQTRKMDREVLFLLTDRTNRRTNLNDLVGRGDRGTLRLLSELKDLNIDGWDKQELLRATAQLEYRITRMRPQEFESAHWTGIGPK